MKTIYITNALNNIKAYQLVRHFSYDQNVYLIYTNNKRYKENGMPYVENYVAIQDNEQTLRSLSNNEWFKFQTIIKTIAEESSLGIVTKISDITTEDRSSFLVISNRSFKVIPFYHNLISSNYNDKMMHTKNINILDTIKHNQNFLYQYEFGDIETPEINYTREYYNLKKENEILKQELTKIKNTKTKDFNS